MKFIQNYKKLPDTLKASLAFISANFFSGILTKIFLNIYIFQINNSFYELVIFNIIFYFVTSFVYILTSFFVCKYNLSLKNLYKIAIPFYGLSFLYLYLAPETINSAYIFAIVASIGRGIFFNVYHSYEFYFTDKSLRPYVSSLRSSVFMVSGIIVSALIALLFFFENSLPFGLSPYDIMFILSAVVFFLVYVFFINKLEDLRINKSLSLSDFKGLFWTKGHRRISLFYAFSGYYAIAGILFSMISFYLLKSEFNVGIYELVFTIFGIIFTMYLGSYLKKGNTYKMLTILSLVYFSGYVILSFFLNIYVYIIFTLIGTVIFSGIHSLGNVYNMGINDILTKHNNNSYANLQYKEMMIVLGRAVIFGLFLITSFYYSEPYDILPFWIFISGITFLAFPILLWHIRDLAQKK